MRRVRILHKASGNGPVEYVLLGPEVFYPELYGTKEPEEVLGVLIKSQEKEWRSPAKLGINLLSHVVYSVFSVLEGKVVSSGAYIHQLVSGKWGGRGEGTLSSSLGETIVSTLSCTGGEVGVDKSSLYFFDPQDTQEELGTLRLLGRSHPLPIQKPIEKALRKMTWEGLFDLPYGNRDKSNLSKSLPVNAEAINSLLSRIYRILSGDGNIIKFLNSFSPINRYDIQELEDFRQEVREVFESIISNEDAFGQILKSIIDVAGEVKKVVINITRCPSARQPGYSPRTPAYDVAYSFSFDLTKEDQNIKSFFYIVPIFFSHKGPNGEILGVSHVVFLSSPLVLVNKLFKFLDSAEFSLPLERKDVIEEAKRWFGPKGGREASPVLDEVVRVIQDYSNLYVRLRISKEEIAKREVEKGSYISLQDFLIKGFEEVEYNLLESRKYLDSGEIKFYLKKSESDSIIRANDGYFQEESLVSDVVEGEEAFRKAYDKIRKKMLDIGKGRGARINFSSAEVMGEYVCAPDSRGNRLILSAHRDPAHLIAGTQELYPGNFYRHPSVFSYLLRKAMSISYSDYLEVERALRERRGRLSVFWWHKLELLRARGKEVYYLYEKKEPPSLFWYIPFAKVGDMIVSLV